MQATHKMQPSNHLYSHYPINKVGSMVYTNHKWMWVILLEERARFFNPLSLFIYTQLSSHLSYFSSGFLAFLPVEDFNCLTNGTNQRSSSECEAFCNCMNPRGACLGRGVCSQGKTSFFVCKCDKGYKKGHIGACVPKGKGSLSVVFTSRWCM